LKKRTKKLLFVSNDCALVRNFPVLAGQKLAAIGAAKKGLDLDYEMTHPFVIELSHPLRSDQRIQVQTF
jgi:hypothetical protein